MEREKEVLQYLEETKKKPYLVFGSWHIKKDQIAAFRTQRDENQLTIILLSGHEIVIKTTQSAVWTEWIGELSINNML